MSPPQSGNGFSFFGMVGTVMAALRLKEHFDGYKQVQADEEARVALANGPTYRDVDGNEEQDNLLDTQIQSRQAVRKRSKPCCMCCGLDCTIFWKAIGIVVGLCALYGVVKALVWAITPAPTGLEGQPEWSRALECVGATHRYNDTDAVNIKLPVGNEQEHLFDIHGGAAGTITIAEAAENASEVEYRFSLSSNDPSTLKWTTFQYPDFGKSRFIVHTARLNDSQCMRFDVTILVPPNLKRLHVASHATAHIRMDETNTGETLDNLSLTLYSTDKRNMIVSHDRMHAKRLALEVYVNGYIVGDVAVRDKVSILTQRGAGIASVRAHALAGAAPAVLESVTGAGRTDIVYTELGLQPHRPIKSTHMSSLNGDVYLTYKDSGFRGRVQLASATYSATGLQRTKSQGEEDQWTHWVGDMNGEDTLYVRSKGWTGLYF